MFDEDIVNNIMIDAGSGFIRAGLDCDSEPRVNIPSVYKGKRPIVRGAVLDWNAWEGLMYDTFRALGRGPECENVLLSDLPLNTKANRERATQILFENLRVGCLYICTGETLALSRMGASTGLVIMLGDGVTHMVPIYNGCALPQSILRLDFGGSDLDVFMKDKLAKEGTTVDLNTARSIKESQCSVVAKGETATTARTLVPEALFQPSLLGRAFGGIHSHANEAIQRCDVNIRQDLYRNIIVAGGSARFPGIVARLANEIGSLAPPDVSSAVTVTAAPIEAVWKGGAALAGTNGFQTKWIRAHEYQDVGPTIVNTKCV